MLAEAVLLSLRREIEATIYYIQDNDNERAKIMLKQMLNLIDNNFQLIKENNGQ